MATIKSIRKNIVDARNSLRSTKAGLSYPTTNTPEGKRWREYVKGLTDNYREILNKIIAEIDELAG